MSIDPCVEIPFVDGAEGACTNTTTHKAYWVTSADWLAQRPTMIMIRASDWTKIKMSWLEGCRKIPGSCNVQMIESIDKTVQQLNSMAALIKH